MSFAKMMEKLKEEYVDTLPEKIHDIESHFKSERIDYLKEDFHKLKGTGKTYGLPEISTLAEVVERLCVLNPEVAFNVIPDALNLLREIHASRSTDNELNIDADSRFHKMRILVA